MLWSALFVITSFNRPATFNANATVVVDVIRILFAVILFDRFSVRAHRSWQQSYSLAEAHLTCSHRRRIKSIWVSFGIRWRALTDTRAFAVLQSPSCVLFRLACTQHTHTHLRFRHSLEQPRRAVVERCIADKFPTAQRQRRRGADLGSLIGCSAQRLTTLYTKESLERRAAECL